MRAGKPWPIERPEKVSQTFSYYAPGQIRSGTGFRGKGGRQDYTVYSQIRFPLAEAPAYAGTELFHRGPRTRISDPNDIQPAQIAQNPWRDNFCERRGFSVSQCPVGIGHQGQDVRPLICRPAPNSDRCDPPGDVVAARDGVILRSLRQEAAYLFVNSANEHIRFRYMHMSPRKMDADNLLSGRRVYEGEVIGEVGNYSMRENGTSYHLHFDIQVPTKDGWVFVNPYTTLVAAYERLIGERGTELADPSVVATADPTVTGAVTGTEASRVEPPRRKKPNWAKGSRNKAKWRDTPTVNRTALTATTSAVCSDARTLLEWLNDSDPPSCHSGRARERGAVRARRAGSGAEIRHVVCNVGRELPQARHCARHFGQDL